MSPELLFIPAAILYLLVVAALYVYGINFYYLTFIAARAKSSRRPEPEQPADWPHVSIQFPIYNEMYVARRLIEAGAAVDYPRDRLEIQILDDSTDETVEIVAETVAKLRDEGVNIHHLHRIHREGYKAGALRDGLATVSGDFVAIFDADFIPTPGFLKATIPHFADEDVAFVQARWDHANRDYSLLTFLQSLSIDAHFMVEQFSRSAAGYWFNFNGTAGVWRKAAIEDAGGWQARTLTEDLDLSYRAFLRGWQARYLHDVTVPAELPVTFNGFRRQQHRWARGSLENAGSLIPKIWRGDYPLQIKIESTLHLTGYGVHLLLFALCLIYPLVVFLSESLPELVSLFGIALIFNFTALAPTLFFTVAQIQLKRAWWQLIPAIIFASFFGSGMMLNTVRAALEIPLRRVRAFERTPKHGIMRKGQSWRKKKYQIKLDRIIFAELLLGAMNLVSGFFALRFEHWFIAFYTFMFAVGLFFNAIYTLIQSIQSNHALQEA